MIKKAHSDDEILKCYEVIAELRPHLCKDNFLTLVRSMETEGYRLSFAEVTGEIVAVAGYRVYTNLFIGKHLYVDDLVTSSNNRSQGYGQQLIEWLRNEAKKEKCSYVDLDSGTHRGDAHRFYFNQGFTIASFHFSERLPQE